jgi:hypothetical protein
VESIKKRLTFLREGGATVNLITARAIIIATILHMKPDILEQKFKDSSTFRASDSFVRKFLHGLLSWSLRKATQAAQKLPKDWEDQCERSFFRKAYVIKEEDIPAKLYVNSDQTQLVYAPGNRMTWAQTGSKQVAVVEMDEKRAFTLLVSVATDGTILPFQAIFQGKTRLSLPAASSPNYDDTMKAGRKPTGLIRKRCVHLLMIFSHLTLMGAKSSLGFQSSKKASGKLTSGRSTVPRNFGVGCVSNIRILSSTSCQEAAQEFTNPVMLGFSNYSNYQQGNLTMKMLSTIF